MVKLHKLCLICFKADKEALFTAEQLWRFWLSCLKEKKNELLSPGDLGVVCVSQSYHKKTLLLAITFYLCTDCDFVHTDTQFYLGQFLSNDLQSCDLQITLILNNVFSQKLVLIYLKILKLIITLFVNIFHSYSHNLPQINSFWMIYSHVTFTFR